MGLFHIWCHTGVCLSVRPSVRPFVCTCLCCACVHACVVSIHYSLLTGVCSHSAAKTVGVFWLNSAETWIDITSATAGQVCST